MTVEEKVKAFFERQTDSTEVHTTSDGNLFRRRDHAKAHASRLKDKAVTTYTKPNAVKPKPKNVLEGSIKEVENAIKDIKDLQVIDALIIQEQDNANRKGAIEVLEAQKTALTPKA